MKRLILGLFFISSVTFAADTPAPDQPSTPSPENRVASLLISEELINSQLALHTKKSELIKELKVTFDPVKAVILLKGKLQVPVEEMRAVNLDPKLGAFRFQWTIKPETTRNGYLILEFPLQETFFYPANSKNIKEDRVIVPVQMLSLALASIRGYLAALSGDFSGFDRRTAKIKALMRGMDVLISREKNADALDDLKNQRAALKLQLEAVPIERKQLEAMSKEVSHLMGFTGEKELNLNDELGARKNALVFKIKISQVAPYLSGVELGGVRILKNHRETDPQNYLAIDVNSVMASAIPSSANITPKPKNKTKISPSLIIRLNQALFESAAVLNAEKAKLPSNIRELTLQLEEDGLHVHGKYHKWFFNVPFETVVDFVTTDTDTFEVRVRNVEIAGMDVEWLSAFVLEAIQKRFEVTMAGICDFKYLGKESDKSRALQIKVNAAKMVPAFPDLHLVDVDVRDREFILKIGRI